MSKNLQRGPFSSTTRAMYLLMQRRIHFPKDRIGEIVDGGEDFEIFRHMTLDPSKDQPGKREYGWHKTSWRLFLYGFRNVGLTPLGTPRMRTKWSICSWPVY